MSESAHDNADGAFSRAPFGRTGVWGLVFTVLAIWTGAAIAGCQRQPASESPSAPTSTRQSGSSTASAQAKSHQAALAGLVHRFDQSLVSARKRLAAAQSASAEQRTAEDLASLCGRASDRVDALKGDPRSSATKQVLGEALESCGHAYRELAEAAGRLRSGDYAKAVKGVYRADAAIAAALARAAS